MEKIKIEISKDDIGTWLWVVDEDGDRVEFVGELHITSHKYSNVKAPESGIYKLVLDEEPYEPERAAG